MSLDFLKTYGEGVFELRLVIEGFPYEFVTDGMITGTRADGRERHAGLLRSGLARSEQFNVTESISEPDGGTATIVDVEPDNAATYAFSKNGAVLAYLDDAITDSDTNLVLVSRSRLTVNNYYHIGREVIKYTSTGAGQSINVTRQQWGTYPQYHTKTIGDSEAYPPIVDWPIYLKGRRVAVYIHSVTETALTDDGTVAARYVMGAEPRDNGDGSWALTLDPFTEALRGSIGTALDEPELQITGITYAYHGLVIALYEHSGTGIDSNVNATAIVCIDGHWATQNDFLADLQDEIDSTTTAASFNGTVTCSGDQEDGGWGLAYVTDASTVRYISARVWGDADCSTPGNRLAGYYADGQLEEPSEIVSASTRYIIKWPQVSTDELPLRRVPRRATASRLGSQFVGVVPTPGTMPTNRWYFDRARLLTAGDTVGFRASFTTSEDIDEWSAKVDAVSAASGYVDLVEPSGVLEDSRIRTTSVPYKLHGSQEFLATVSIGDGAQDLEGFRTSLVTKAKESGNLGLTPFVTSDDFESWASVVTRATQSRPYATREFVFQSEAEVEDIIKDHLRLLGLGLRMSANQKLEAFVLARPSITETAAQVIVSSDLTLSEDQGRLLLAPDGVVNVVEIKTKWDPKEKKHIGPTLRVRHVPSISAWNKRRALVVEPKTTAPNGDVSDQYDALQIAGPYFALAAWRTVSVELPVTWESFGLKIGDTVTVTAPNVAWNGSRGINAEVGIVTGINFPFDSAGGSIKVLFSTTRIAGYAPSGRVTTQSGSGTAWTVTIAANQYSTGATDASWFAVNDRIEIYKHDNATPGAIGGTIDAINGNDLDITFDSTWTPGSDTWDIRYIEVKDASLQASQLEFAWVSDSTIESDGLAPYVYS